MLHRLFILENNKRAHNIPEEKKSQLLVVMLSGVPCSGKTTWRTQLVNMLKELNIPTTVISSDEIAIALRDMHNKCNLENPISYNDICNQPKYRENLEQKYKAAIINANKQDKGVIILDRTYLAPKWRKLDLDLLKIHPTFAVHFVVNNENAWKERLIKRNEQTPSQTVSFDIIEKLRENSSTPEIKEGFESIISCPAIGEPHWQDTFKNAILKIINYYGTIQEKQLSQQTNYPESSCVAKLDGCLR
jgi:2-phosphoglycerate kinase